MKVNEALRKPVFNEERKTGIIFVIQGGLVELDLTMPEVHLGNLPIYDPRAEVNNLAPVAVAGVVPKLWRKTRSRGKPPLPLMGSTLPGDPTMTVAHGSSGGQPWFFN